MSECEDWENIEIEEENKKSEIKIIKKCFITQIYKKKPHYFTTWQN